MKRARFIHYCRVAAACAVVTIAATAIGGCAGEKSAPAGALYSCDEFTLWPDSLVVDGREVKVEADSVISTESIMLLSGSYLLNDLFNGETTAGDTVAGMVYIPDPLIDPEKAVKAAWSVIDSLRAESVDGKQYPIVQTRSRSLARLIDVVNATGDADLAKKLASEIVDLLDTDFALTLDGDTRLFSGIDPDALCSASLPKWFNAADCAAALSYRTNIDHLALIRYLLASEAAPADRRSYLTAYADTLADAIDTNFWQPSAGYYSRLLYSTPYPIALLSTDLAAQADGVTKGLTRKEMTAILMRRTPLYQASLSQFYPACRQTAVTDATVMADWVAAASKASNSEAFQAALSMLVKATATDSAIGDEAFKSAVVRGLFGVDISASDRMEFHPFVPQLLPGPMILHNLRYRKACLSVELQGYGNIISTFAIDGEPTDNFYLPATIEGDHTVTITLVGIDTDSQDITPAKADSLPSAPVVEWNTATMTATVDKSRNAEVMLYIDGAADELLRGDSYQFALRPVTMTASFVSVADGVAGFSTRPRMMSGDSIAVSITDFVRPWSRSLPDRNLARTHVETTRYRNRELTFEIDLINGGDYYLSISYLNGEGIVNPERRYSTRLLEVNESQPRLVVFPQLTPNDWRHDTDWQTIVGHTLPMAVTLQKGRNYVRLKYYNSDLDHFNHDTNTLIPASLILYPR